MQILVEYFTSFHFARRYTNPLWSFFCPSKMTIARRKRRVDGSLAKSLLQNKFLLKFMSQELKFSQNRPKLGLKMQNFSENRSGVSRAGKGLEIVGLQSGKNGLKKGVLWTAHPLTAFQCECPPWKLPATDPRRDKMIATQHTIVQSILD